MAKEIKGLKPVAQMKQDLYNQINSPESKVSIDRSIHTKSDSDRQAIKKAKQSYKNA